MQSNDKTGNEIFLQVHYFGRIMLKGQKKYKVGSPYLSIGFLILSLFSSRFTKKRRENFVVTIRELKSVVDVQESMIITWGLAQ